MRNLDGDLGTNHKLHVINKRKSTGLLEQQVRESLVNIKPDFVYVHLGINDLADGSPAEEIITRFGNFVLFLDDKLPRSRVIFSYPLLTANKHHNELILRLRAFINDWTRNLDSTVEIKDRQLLLNVNSNFETKGDLYDRGPRLTQVQDLFSDRDGVHLTDAGKRLILGNFRHCVHDITRRILNKPKRRRTRT